MSIVVRDLNEMIGRVVWFQANVFSVNPFPKKYQVAQVLSEGSPSVVITNGEMKFVVSADKRNKKRIFNTLFDNEIGSLEDAIEMLNYRIEGKDKSNSLVVRCLLVLEQFEKRRNILLLQEKI